DRPSLRRDGPAFEVDELAQEKSHLHRSSVESETASRLIEIMIIDGLVRERADLMSIKDGCRLDRFGRYGDLKGFVGAVDLLHEKRRQKDIFAVQPFTR